MVCAAHTRKESVVKWGNPRVLAPGAYRAWRARKLAAYPADAADLGVEIAKLAAPSAQEIRAVRGRCRAADMAIYPCPEGAPAGAYIGRETIRRFAAAFGRRRLDRHPLADESGITALSAAADGRRRRERAARPRDRLHSPARRPPARCSPSMARAARCTCGFRRARNIVWRDDRATRAARTGLEALLADPQGPAIRRQPAPGQGIIGNNVLHDRTAFRDGETGQRLVYRARCLNRIAGTGPKDTR